MVMEVYRTMCMELYEHNRNEAYESFTASSIEAKNVAENILLLMADLWRVNDW